jgi:hypothetical protein
MIKQTVIAVFLFFSCHILFAQKKPLPNITVKNIGDKIIISWVNDYTKPITTLNIQRSFDSLKNYKTVGSVLSPQSKENGYADNNAPYNKMYYRVFVAFEGGLYAYSNIERPVKDTTRIIENIDQQMPWLRVKDNDSSLLMPNGKPKITYPSQTIYTLKDNNIIIHLQNTDTKKYSVKFYDEANNLLFEIRKVKEDDIIIEKVNFGKTGWYHFELFEDGELIESNKFQIQKAIKGL